MNVKLPARGAGLSRQDTGKLKKNKITPHNLARLFFYSIYFPEIAGYKPLAMLSRPNSLILAEEGLPVIVSQPNLPR